MPTETIYGKPIDIQKLKKPVLANLAKHVEATLHMIEYLNKNEVPINQNHCYICGASSSKPFSLIHGFQYVECQNCWHVYTSTRFSSESLERFYKNTSYYSQITYANEETCFYRRDQVARPKVEYLEKYTDQIKGIWLDVGSGIGDIPSVLLDKGWKAFGLELSDSSIKFAKKIFGVDLLPYTLSDYLEANTSLKNTVDVVSLIGIIEHVVDPLAMLKDSYALLKPGGLVMVQVPNANSLASRLQRVYPENVFRHQNPVDHIMLFTRSSLETSLSKCGFTPISYWFHGLDIYELLTILMMTNQRVVGSDLAESLYKLMNPLQLVVDQNELSNSILCIAKKS